MSPTLAVSVNSAIALDLGTTLIKAGVVDSNCQLKSFSSLSAPEISVKDGCYESDALLYVKKTEQLLHKYLIHSGKSSRLGIACQRSSFLLWEKSSGRPVTPFISWQDSRGADSISRLRRKERVIQNLTGLRLAPYYLAPKLSVLLEQRPELRAGLEQGDLLVGTLDSFIIWRWSSGNYYQTDASMAARTLLMNIHQQHWSSELCSSFAINPAWLPRIKPSTNLNQRLKQDIVLQASVADQSAALLASVDDGPKQVLVNLGTGGFVIRFQTDQSVLVNKNYLYTLVYQDQHRRSYFAIEGTLNAIGSALVKYPYTECRFEDLGQNPDVFCIAEPSGIGAPYFRTNSGLVFSDNIDSLTQQQIAVLLLEAIIFRVVRILNDFNQEDKITCVILSGGLSELDCLRQGIARCSGLEVYKLLQKESTLLGAGILALNLNADFESETEHINVTCGNMAILKKYQRWKKWFDQLLNDQ